MPEMHLKQPGFNYSASGPFTKNKERIEKFMQTGKNFIYKNELDKACFQHDMVHGKSKDLTKRTQSDNVLRDKAFKITNDPKYNGYQRGLASMIKSLVEVVLTLDQIISLLMNFIVRLLENLGDKKSIHLLETKFGGVDLADMQSLGKYNIRIKYLLCAIDFFSKYAWVVPLKHKSGISTVNAFQKEEAKGGKPNKI